MIIRSIVKLLENAFRSSIKWIKFYVDMKVIFVTKCIQKYFEDIKIIWITNNSNGNSILKLYERISVFGSSRIFFNLYFLKQSFKIELNQGNSNHSIELFRKIATSLEQNKWNLEIAVLQTQLNSSKSNYVYIWWVIS